MTQQVLLYFQVGVATLLGAAILLQQKGQGLSGAFGGEGGFYRTKRGFEKTLFISTIVLSVLFIAAGIVRIVVVTSETGMPTEISLPSSPDTAIFPSIDLNNIGTEGQPLVPLAVPNAPLN